MNLYFLDGSIVDWVLPCARGAYPAYGHRGSLV
jgi:hypothetical protein